MRNKIIMLASIVALAALAFACGGDDDSAAQQTPDIAPGYTPPPADLLTPVPPPTIAADAELTRFDGVRWPYVIYYPTGWEPKLDGPSVDEWYLYSETGLNRAHLSVLCGGSAITGTAKIEDMQLQDAQLIRYVESRSGTIEDAEVAGRRALKWNYTINFPGSPAASHNFVYYVQGNEGECSYRIRVNAIGILPVDSYSALLDRIVENFIPDRGSTEG